MTFVKLSPLYLVVGAILYVLIFMDKDVDYYQVSDKLYKEGKYDQALNYLDKAIEKNIYKGSRLVETYKLRAKTYKQLQGFLHAIEDLDTAISLRPSSTLAKEAKLIKGEIYILQEEYLKALDIFQDLISDSISQEDQYLYKCNAAAAAFNLSSSILTRIKIILDQSLTDYTEAFDLVTAFTTDLHNNYEIEDIKSVLLDKMSVIKIKEVSDLSFDSQRYYKQAYDLLSQLSGESDFNSMASLFYAKILYKSKQLLPAMIECSLASKATLWNYELKAFLEIMAKIYDDLGADQQSAETYGRIMKLRDPEGIRELLRNLNIARYKAGKYKPIITFCRRMYDRGTADPTIRFCLGASYMKSKQKAEGLKILEELLNEIRAGKTPYYFNTSFARRECLNLLYEAYLEGNNLVSALELINIEIRLYPEDLSLRKKRASLLHHKMNRPNDAIDDYYHLLNKGPRDKEIYAKWKECKQTLFSSVSGITFQERAALLTTAFQSKIKAFSGDKERQDDLNRAASFNDLNREPLMLLNLGQEFFRRDLKEEGLSILRRLVRLFPNVLEFQYILGTEYYKDNRCDLAIPVYEPILQRAPLDFETVRNLLKCYDDCSLFTEKGRLIQKVLQSKDPYLVQWILTRIKFEKKRWESFLKSYESITKMPPHMQDDLDLMAAYCWIENKKLTFASAIIDSFLDKNPDHIEALKVKAFYLISAMPKEAEEDVKPQNGDPVEEEQTPIQALVEHFKTLGPALTKFDVQDLFRIFIDGEQPQLVLNLLSKIQLPFKLTEEHKREVATALAMLGEHKRAANILLQLGSKISDLKKAFAYGVLAGAPGWVSHEVITKANTLAFQNNELYLLVAAGNALGGRFLDAQRYLDKSKEMVNTGDFTLYEAEYIDFLTRLLLDYGKKKLDPLDLIYSEPEAEPPLDEEITQDPKDAEEKEAEEPPLEAEVEETPEEEEETVQDEGADEESIEEEFLLNGMKLSELYKEILPEAEYLMELRKETPEKDFWVFRDLAHILLFQVIPGLEEEQSISAQNILELYPGCGLAARHILKSEENNSVAKTIELLTPVNIYAPTDFKSMSLLAVALAQTNSQKIFKACMTQLELIAKAPLELKRVKAEVFIAQGDPATALIILNEIINDEGVDPGLLIRLCPILCQVNATEQLLETVKIIKEKAFISQELRQSVIDYLRSKKPLKEAEQVLAEELMEGAPAGQRFVLMSTLSRVYPIMEEEERLTELAHELLNVKKITQEDKLHLNLALISVATGLINQENFELASDLLEYQYFLHPDLATPLSILAKLAIEEMNRVQKAAEYLELYNLLKPWETRNGLKLADIWFHHTGSPKRAYDLVNSNIFYFRENPELVIRINMGYHVLLGDYDKVIELARKYRFRKEAQASPHIIFLTGFANYMKDETEAALVLFQLLNNQHLDNPYYGRCNELIRELRAKKKELQKKKKPSKAPKKAG